MNDGRWDNYRKANDTFPHVRNNELSLMLDKVATEGDDIILECGTGNGYLTFPIAQKVKDGKIITYDVTTENLHAVQQKNAILQLPIEIREQKSSYDFFEANNSIDKIVSIASFHHYDSTSLNTGVKGRLKALREFQRMLKPGGLLILADVAKDTDSSRYFKSIDNPTYCFPNGHPHDFLNEHNLRDLCKQTGFLIKEFEIKDVPWQFASKKQAQQFLHTIHNARCSEEESLRHAIGFLNFWQKNDTYYLDWQLFYMVAEKVG